MTEFSFKICNCHRNRDNFDYTVSNIVTSNDEIYTVTVIKAALPHIIVSFIHAISHSMILGGFLSYCSNYCLSNSYYDYYKE